MKPAVTTAASTVPFAAPWKLFAEWFDEAKAAKLPEETWYWANAMALATATPDGFPSCRMVLMQRFDPTRGRIAFYTNYNGRKAQELASNPQASVLFYWNKLEKQIRIEGTVVRATTEESDEYWLTRPKESRVASIASAQSEMLESAEAMKKKIDDVRAQFVVKKGEDGEDELGEVPRPPHLGMYWIVPSRRMEFWQNGEFRVHTRHVFEPVVNEDGDQCWKTFMLQP